MTTTTTATSSFSSLFQALGQELGTDVSGGAKNLLTAFFTNVKANPSTQSVIAQGAILAASAPLQLPNLEQEAIGQIADVGLALTSLLPSAPAPASS